MYRILLMSLSGLFLLGLAACDNGGGGSGGGSGGSSGTEQPATPAAPSQ